MQPLLAENYEKIASICRAHHVKHLAVFGSAVRDDFDPERSDLDFVYEFNPVSVEEYADNFFALAEELEALLGRKVDLVSLEYVRNPYIRSNILTQQETLYAA